MNQSYHESVNFYTWTHLFIVVVQESFLVLKLFTADVGTGHHFLYMHWTEWGGISLKKEKIDPKVIKLALVNWSLPQILSCRTEQQNLTYGLLLFAFT